LLAVTIAIAAGAVPFLEDDAPPTDEVVQGARERGVEGPIFVPEREEPDPNARPERYGPYLLVPQGWSGPLDATTIIAEVDRRVGSADLNEVRTSELWIDARNVPSDYRLTRADSENLDAEVRQVFETRGGDGVFLLYILRQQVLPIQVETWNTKPKEGETANFYELTEIRGLPTVISHRTEDGGFSVTVDTFDAATGLRYVVHSLDTHLPEKQAVEILEGILQ
jgi:hypothetical protein